MARNIAPKLEVIRFYSAEDVIVTSGSSFLSLSSNRTYFSLGSEIEDAFPNSDTSYSTDRYYKFNYNTTSPGFSFVSGGSPVKIREISDTLDYWAWYDNGWFTENKLKNDYLGLDGKYKWRIDNSN